MTSGTDFVESVEARSVERAAIAACFESDELGLTINISYEYFIEWHRLDTPEKVLRWVMHLTEKPWMTQDHTLCFIQICAGKFDFDQTMP